MLILVTGASGQVGRSLVRLGGDYGFNMVGKSHSELDVTNLRNIEAVMHDILPDLVINASAYTAVDKSEREPDVAYSANEDGPRLLAIATNNANIPLFHISTDYVFDGVLDRPYNESDIVNPGNIYGKSKEAGEQAVRDANQNHMILRTSWVFSAVGNNFVTTMIRLAATEAKLNVVDDQLGGPTSSIGISITLLELVRIYLERGELNWGTYHFSGQPFVSWYDFSKEIFKHAFELGVITTIPEVIPVDSNFFSSVAKRPINSRLSMNKLTDRFFIEPEDWVESLRSTCQEITDGTI